MGLGYVLGRRSPRPRTPARPRIRSVMFVAGSLDASTGLLSEEVIRQVSALFLAEHWRIVWCGMGSGLAGAVVRAVLGGGGQATAVVVKKNAPSDVPDGVERVEVANFHLRQRALFARGDAALVLPGGVGTLSELTELAAFRSVGLYKKPVVLLDPNGWFEPVRAFLKQASDGGITPCHPPSMFVSVSAASEIKNALERG